MRSATSASRAAAAFLVALALISCSDPSGPGAPARIGIVAGDNQTAEAGAVLPLALVVEVTDDRGRTVPDVALTWQVVSGGGSLSTGDGRTDGTGRMQVTWQLGTASGANTLSVSAGPTLTAQGTAMATAGPPAQFVRVSGSDLAAGVGQPLPAPLVVRVMDRFGNGVPAVDVVFAPLDAAGVIQPGTVQTDTEGRAQASWQLGPTAGTQRAAATIAALAPLEFTAHAHPGPLARVAIDRDSVRFTALGQTAQLAATGWDGFDNSLGSSSFTWSSSANAVAVDPNGRITAAANGVATVTARREGVSASIAVRVAQVPAAVTIATASTGVQTGDSVQLTAVIRDAGGAAIPGEPVAWSSSDVTIASVSPTGWVRGVSAGAVQITAAAANVPAVAASVPLNVVAGLTLLTSDVPVTGLAGVAGSVRQFRVVVPAGATQLQVTTNGGAGNADLYLRRAQPATTTAFDCVSDGPANAETCTISSPAAGDWFVALHGFTGYSAVTLLARYSAGPPTGIAVSVNGLPPTAAAAITVAGPNGYTADLTGSTTLTGLASGAYTVTAHPVVHAGTTYTPAPAVQQLTVNSGVVSGVAVAYGQDGVLNLAIDGLYLIQATQTYAGTVPLVAGRDALLRVFVRASFTNTVTPAVRVRFYSNGQLLDTHTVQAPQVAVPTSITEHVLGSSWNVTLPASLVQPGLAILADVDPNDVFAEADENDNTFPASGTPLAIDVRTAPPFRVRFVPVIQTPNGLVGDVTESNKDNWMNVAQAVYPFASYDASVRAPYSFDKAIPSAYDSIWARLLSEIRTLRTLDGDTRHYYGVFRPSFNSGGTGVGYVGSPAAIGVDWNTSTNLRQYTAAHEWGHNFGRQHVNCGNPAQPDLQYPYANGRIGVFGYDQRSLSLLAPSSFADLLSYCRPEWISDYTWRAVMTFRAGQAAQVAGELQPALVVWGRITDDGVVLEPAFVVNARPSLPARPGPNRITGSAGAQVLFDLSFDGDEIDHIDGDRHFSFAVPLGAGAANLPDELRLRARGREAVRRAAPLAAVAPGATAVPPRATRRADGRVLVEWDDRTHEAALIRDATTGDVLAIARTGTIELTATADALDIVLSDGVRSDLRRVPVTGR